MFKIMFGLSRKQGTTLQTFRNYWLEDHAPKVARLPNLRRYTIDIRTDDSQDGIDGFATLWFDSQEAFAASFSSDYARTTVVPNNANFNQPDKIVRWAVETFEIPVG